MPADQRSLISFAESCQRRLGKSSTHWNDEGVFIFLERATVHLKLDPSAGRVAFWSDLARPDRLSDRDLAQVVADFVGDRFLESGVSMGFVASAKVICLGRSCDASVLHRDEAFDIIENFENEIVLATARLEEATHAARRPGRLSQAEFMI